VGDPMRERIGLARTRAGNHEKRRGGWAMKPMTELFSRAGRATAKGDPAAVRRQASGGAGHRARQDRPCRRASPLLPEHGSQFHLATFEIAKKLFKSIQSSGPSNQIVKLVNCPFSTLFLKQGRHRLLGHFETIAQRKSVGPRNSPEGSFDSP
jgi:hypothetical protein